MTTFALRRLIRLPILLLILSAVIFLSLHVGPRTPESYVGVDVTEERRLSIGGDFTFRTKLIDDYRTWIPDSIIGDLGDSGFYDRPVEEVLRDRAGPTLLLLTAALVIAYGIGIPLALRSLRYRRRTLDLLVGALSGFGAALPTFLLGLSLAYVFALRTALLPASGYLSGSPWTQESGRYLILPISSLALPLLSQVTRFTRTILRNASRAPFARAARGMGIPDRRAIVRHHLRVALSPLSSTLGTIAAHAIAGVVVVEYLFEIPGLGSLMIEAIDRRDFAIIQGIVLLACCVLLLVFLTAELLAAWFDPRLRQR